MQEDLQVERESAVLDPEVLRRAMEDPGGMPVVINGVPDAADGLTLIHTMTANSAGILDFLHEMKREVFDGKNVFTVAEANGILPEDLKFWVGDSGVFDMLFEFEHLQGSDIWFSTKTRSTKEIKQAIFKSEKETAKNGWYRYDSRFALPVFAACLL